MDGQKQERVDKGCWELWAIEPGDEDMRLQAVFHRSDWLHEAQAQLKDAGLLTDVRTCATQVQWPGPGGLPRDRESLRSYILARLDSVLSRFFVSRDDRSLLEAERRFYESQDANAALDKVLGYLSTLR